MSDVQHIAVFIVIIVIIIIIIIITIIIIQYRIICSHSLGVYGFLSLAIAPYVCWYAWI